MHAHTTGCDVHQVSAVFRDTGRYSDSERSEELDFATPNSPTSQDYYERHHTVGLEGAMESRTEKRTETRLSIEAREIIPGRWNSKSRDWFCEK